MVTTTHSLADWLATEFRPEPRLPVYQTERPRYRPEYFAELARAFGIIGERDRGFNEVQQREGVHLAYKGEQVLVLYEHSGAFFYADRSKLNSRDYRPELPSVRQAAGLARAYLREHGWLPEHAALDGVSQGVFEIATGERGEQHSVQANHLVVDYRLKFGDLLTYGPGAKIKLYLGHRGEVIGLVHAVRPARRLAESPSTSRDDLERILSRKLGVPLDTVTLLEARLALFAESYALDSRFLQPTYIFSLAAPIQTRRQEQPVEVQFMTHPIPATAFGPQATLDLRRHPKRVRSGQPLKLRCRIQGGTEPYQVSWSSNIDGHLSDGPVLETRALSVAHREERVISHTIHVMVTDANGFQDSSQTLVRVLPRPGQPRPIAPVSPPDDPADPYVGVEWCNLYNGALPDISNTDPTAQGFKQGLDDLSGWSVRFDWGNDAALEQDFKFASAPGGGRDFVWVDNVHFAFFAGHGGPGAVYFGSTIDDHQLAAADARWGDGLLNWMVLHACSTMRDSFEWTVWCPAFKGLHQMFGFHSITEGSIPPLGSRFAFWAALPSLIPIVPSFTLQDAWRLACSECFDAGVQYAMIDANQLFTDTQHDHLPGFGHVSADPTAPNAFTYQKGSS